MYLRARYSLEHRNHPMTMHGKRLTTTIHTEITNAIVAIETTKKLIAELPPSPRLQAACHALQEAEKSSDNAVKELVKLLGVVSVL
jgi:hypothetical protein